ncbi:MAG: hypothetical protein Crog4KO_21460 [Crocinitomicaceae bacterium]
MILAGALVASTLISCKKETISPEPQTPSSEQYSSLDEYLNTKAVAPQTFSFQAQDGTTFTGANGTVVTIPANALIDASGTPISGSVNGSLEEVFSNGEIMFSRIFPRAAGGNVLNSGGEFNLEITQNGNQLRVANGQMIQVELPAQAEDLNMQLFFADAAELDSANIGWGNPVDSIQSASGFTFSSVDQTYSLDLDSMGWCNIDAFMWTVQYFDIDFTLSGVNGLDNSNTTAFAVFKDANGVWPMGESIWGSINNNIIAETHLADVPMNVVVISVVNGQLYYGLLDVTPQQGMQYDIPMQATTSAALDAIIQALE